MNLAKNDYIRYEEKDGRHALVFDLELSRKPSEDQMKELFEGVFKEARKGLQNQYLKWYNEQIPKSQ